MSGDKKESNPWADLVIAILSVNNYPLEKTFALFSSLEDNGLFDPTVLADLSSADVARKLGAAGYNRGDTMTAIFTERLTSLGKLAASVPVESTSNILQSGDHKEVSSLLSGVKGIGPKVLAKFFLLRGDAQSEPAHSPVSR